MCFVAKKKNSPCVQNYVKHAWDFSQVDWDFSLLRAFTLKYKTMKITKRG